MSEFWEIFTNECITKGKTPNGVAKEIGISSGTITNWKNGAQPSVFMARKLGNYFGRPAVYFLGIEDQVKSKQQELLSMLDDNQIDIQVNELIRLYKECDAMGQIRIAHVIYTEWSRTKNETSD